ncbi:Trk-type K+ transport system, membrane component [Opitutaceae bacterium TAV1]|nr:Trk-type K+ transport system, membrane component [Opitutaceae bacterium TAV1]
MLPARNATSTKRTDSRSRAVVFFLLNTLLVLCSVAALALFVLVAGWPLEPETHQLVRIATGLVLKLFVFQEACRMWLQRHRMTWLKTRRLEAGLCMLIVLEMILGPRLHGWLNHHFPDIGSGTLTLFILAASQLTLLALICLRALRRNRLLATRRLTPGMALILSFAVLILIGTLMLKTPRATTQGIGWIDALFTATSSVCVTGFGTVDITTQLTRYGQWIVLGLVQTGGLGIMTLTYFFAHFLTGGVSLRNRIALQNLLSEDNLGQIGTVLGMIVGFTLTVELAGAVAIWLLAGQGSAAATPIVAGDRAFFALFHAVSAFCNAGISTLPGNLTDPALAGIGMKGVLVVIMLLVVAGGIGFPVIRNLHEVVIARIRQRLGLRLATPPRITTNSRVVLVTTAVLLAGGAVLIYITEFATGNGDPGALGPWMAAIFHSVAVRSAGFNVIDTANLAPATVILTMFLMFVGGSPSSTAGGIKTSTLAVAVLALRRVLLGRPEIEAFGRRISDDIANRALAVLLLAGAFVTLVATTLCVLHPELPALDLLFEAVAAVSTAGLARGVTSQLGDPAKLVMIVAMFVGRIGVLMFLLSFIRRRDHKGYRYPGATIVIT